MVQIDNGYILIQKINTLDISKDVTLIPMNRPLRVYKEIARGRTQWVIYQSGLCNTDTEADLSRNISEEDADTIIKYFDKLTDGKHVLDTTKRFPA